MIRAQRCAAADVRHLLREIEKPKANSAGRINLDRLIRNGLAYRVLNEAGETVAAYLLQPMGAALWVTAFGGRADFDLSYVAAGLVIQHAAQFDEIRFVTERRGLVRKALKKGYEIAGQRGAVYTMKKALQK